MSKQTILQTLCDLRKINECGNNEQLCHQAYTSGSLVEIDPAIIELDISSRAPRPLTDEDKTFIIDNHNKMSVIQIAEAIDRNTASIHSYMRKHDIARYKKRTLRLHGKMVEIIKNNDFFNVDAPGQKNWLV